MRSKLFAFGLLLLAPLFAVAQKAAYTLPEANQILESIHVYLNVALSDSVKSAAGMRNNSYLLPLVNYLDYNVIGKGKVAILHEEKLRDFISTSLESGMSLKEVSTQLIKKYEELANQGDTDEIRADRFQVGGFLVVETEYHQEPDGSFETLMEINQLKLYFASRLNSASNKNNIDVLAEFNPVPEEVIHHIDEVALVPGDTIRHLDLPGDGPVPFERLFVAVNNVAGSKINVTIGQFRNPFGLWSDFSSHRNFSSTKNNSLVNGFALKKIELGLKLDFKISQNLELEAALVHGRLARTSPLYRADSDSKKDFVSHVTFSKGIFFAGASSYLAEFSTKRTAFGLDFGLRFPRLLVSGEWVSQKNKQTSEMPWELTNTNEVSSQSAYVQYDIALGNRLHLYGLYDWWDLKANGKTVNQSAFKIFHGLKYFISPKVRWTIVEYGRMVHTGFDKGNTHLSTQLEINF